MSKTNVYTLIATALLGVLLFVIYRFTERLPTTEMALRDTAELAIERAAVPGYAEVGVPPEGAPRINTTRDLKKLLADVGMDAELVLDGALDWRYARGFLGPADAMGVGPDSAPRRRYEQLDDTQLESLSIGGDIGATQELAARSVTSDPFYAMRLYERAAYQGSTFALLRLASLRDTLSNRELDAYQSDPDYLKQLSRMRQGDDAKLAMNAFAYAFAAVRDGGLPVLDADLLAWMRSLMAKIPLNMDELACRQSESIFLEVSAERRRRGVQPVTTDPPPVFFGVPHAAEQLPCTDTLYAWRSTQDLAQCEVLEIENAQDNTADLYLCGRPDA